MQLSASKTMLSVPADLASRTLGDVVRRMLPDTPWSKARELCRRGKVRRNGELCQDAALRVAEGDQIEIHEHAPRLREHVLDDSVLVHLDEDIVVIDKPAGILTMPFEPEDRNTLVDRLRFLMRRKTGYPRHELGVVQRLDKDTTGVIVFARNYATKRYLQELLRVHDVERRYLAIAHGQVAEQRCETFLIDDRGDGLRGSWGRYKRAHGEPPKGAQRALTDLRPIAPLTAATLVECRLETGRQHQIRIHLSELGHPIVGERVYIRDYTGPQIEAPRPLLHAETLGFVHPRTGEKMTFQRRPPEDFMRTLERLGGSRVASAESRDKPP
jgi:23S rRNA pseudouridine1911/1915/1917 synthase